MMWYFSCALRLRDLLTSVHPGLERAVDVTTKTGLHLLARYVTPSEIRVFCQSVFIAVGCDPASKIFCARKRHEGKTHHQAVLALARGRANVLHAILRTRLPYDPKLSHAAA